MKILIYNVEWDEGIGPLDSQREAIGLANKMTRENDRQFLFIKYEGKWWVYDRVKYVAYKNKLKR